MLRAKPGELLVWVWLAPYFGITGAFLAKFNRYMSPVLPFILLFAAGLITWLWHLETRQRLKLAARVPAGLLGFFAVGRCGLFWSLAYVNGVYVPRAHLDHGKPLGVRQCTGRVGSSVGGVGRPPADVHPW